MRYLPKTLAAYVQLLYAWLISSNKQLNKESNKKPIYRVQSQESALDHNHQANSGNQPRDWMLEERGTLVWEEQGRDEVSNTNSFSNYKRTYTVEKNFFFWNLAIDLYSVKLQSEVQLRNPPYFWFLGKLFLNSKSFLNFWVKILAIFGVILKHFDSNWDSLRFYGIFFVVYKAL